MRRAPYSLVSFTRASPLTQVRLAKRWTSVHMMCPHLHEEAVELLVAAVFVSPGAARAPATASSGLHRWLRLIADHPWGAFPLVRLHHTTSPGGGRSVAIS